MRIFLCGTAILAITLSGCSTIATPKLADASGSPPANYRQAVAENVRITFFDPYSIRDASISEPLYASAVFDGQTPIPRSGWIVCLRANAKNKMGGYIGQQVTVLLFKGERVDLLVSGSDFQGQIDGHCRAALYAPFPEIEQQGSQ